MLFWKGGYVNKHIIFGDCHSTLSGFIIDNDSRVQTIDQTMSILIINNSILML